MPAVLLTLVLLITLTSGAPPVQSGSAGPVTLNKAAFVAEVSNDQREPLVPAAGQKFLWVKASASQAQTIDLTKVVLASGTTTIPLIGVDSAFDGDPQQFSMIAPARLKNGKMAEPLEESRSVGTVAFTFNPGKPATATLKVIAPPQAICLLFAVPATFKTGEIRGLGPAGLKLPPF